MLHSEKMGGGIWTLWRYIITLYITVLNQMV